MGIFDWLGGSTSYGNPQVRTSLSKEDLMALISEVDTNIWYKRYAIQLCINKLASALALCQFETYEKGEKKKDFYWWKFNYEPSVNTNMNDFLYQIIYQMVYNDEGALVVQSDDGQFIVAKSYDINKNSMNGNVYYNVEAYGEFKFARAFNEKDVFHLQLPNKRVHELVNGLYSDYGRLIALSTENYIRDRSLKMVLKVGSVYNQQIMKDEDGNEFDPVQEVMTNRLKTLFDDKNAIIPLEDGLDLQVIDKANGSKLTEASEINELLSKTIDICADAFGIPRGLLKGDVADVEAMTDNFITFAVRPIAKELDTEINRKLYGEERVRKGSKLKVVTNTIQTYNIVSIAAALDKLIAGTVMTPDEAREVIGYEPAELDITKSFKETKNYQSVEDIKS